MLRTCLTWSVLLLGLTTCSPAAESPAAATPTDPATGPAATRPAASPTARVDSLNGLPGHRFGEPLSAFPGLRRIPTNPGGYEVYSYEAGSKQDKTWFGRHEQELHGQVYLFVDGQFAGLRTAAPRPGAALLQEAQYLLGSGTGFGDTRDWRGERVLASWRTTHFGTGELYQQLEILSKPLFERVQQRTQQRLRTENGQ